MNKIMKHLKHNAISVFALNKILDFQCRNVKSYIFVANAGRSGSVTLSKILETVDNAACFHEPSPVMFNNYPQGTDITEYFRRQFRNVKRIYIKNAAKGHDYYVETNHQFVKNFIAPAIESFGNKIKIVHLVRDPVSVASSFYQINSIPGDIGNVGNLYLLDPREERNLIKIADLLYGNEEFKHDLYKCLWYWYEVETRTKMAKQKYPSIKFHKLRTEDLNSIDAVLHMFNHFELPVDETKLRGLIGIRENTRTEEKVNKIDLYECELMNKKLVSQLEKRYGKHFWYS